jgi:arabinoxylan arabinofuranohydrolase
MRKKSFFLWPTAVLVLAALFFLLLSLDSDSRHVDGPVEMASNPVIYADFPDPDVIRVGDTYYMVTTSMHMLPGSPIMRSTDLVNWEIVGYPYESIEDNDAYKLKGGLNAYGKGTWANSLKYHKGKFYVLTASLDTGKTYLFSTDDPAGTWERTEFGGYMHDPALFFDDDDKAYIIYGAENISIKELTPDYKAIRPSGLNKVILSSGKPGMEGAHAYKINGKYYLTFIWWEQGKIRRQYVYRSDRLDGPYEGKLVLSDTMGYKQSGVAQGGLVDTPDGRWYAMLFQDRDAVGRVPVLVPVRWEDGWPVYGDEEGRVPLEFEKPGRGRPAEPLTRSDEFDQESDAEDRPNGSKLGLHWQWNHLPDHTMWSLTERRGFLRLRTGHVADDLLQARNTLTQRSYGPRSSGWIAMDTGGMLDGDYAGLAAFQQEYGFIGVTREEGRRYIVMVEKGVEKARTELEQEQVYLKIDFDFVTDRAKFYYSLNGADWTEFGSELKMRYTIPHFMGYRFALFNFATRTAGGYVDIDYFRFSSDAEGTTTPAVPAAYLKEDAIELSGGKDAVYDVRLVMDEVPAGADVLQIRATVRIPELFEVVQVVPNRSNLTAGEVAWQSTEDGLQVLVENSDGSAVSFMNRDAGKTLLTIQLRLRKELTTRVNEEINVSRLEVVRADQRTEPYDVSGAAAKASFTPPAEAVGKVPPNGNPLVAHKFGADPYALVYRDRVYLYMTGDVLEYDADGNVKENSYGSINKLSVISSDDLVNWTDHGYIHAAGPNGAAKWATQSWAPAIAHKVVDGEDKFFLYFANNASGIGVLTADSPTGPWRDPIGKPLITRATPGVRDVAWLFDPAVLIDDDGKAYIYFGGGIPEGKEAMPNTARVMQLGDDMISVVGEAVTIPAPYMFEDSGINKIGGKYYYTYCSNFAGGVRPPGSPPPGEIAYMVSDHPMGPWEYKGTILKNPGHFFGVGGNNHHVLFQFHGDWYIAYHAQTLAKAMGVAMGYRSTHLNRVFLDDDGAIREIIADLKGVEPVRHLDPFVRVEAETMAWSAGIAVEPADLEDASGSSSPNMAVTDIHNGDWTAVANVDFGSGASAFAATVSSGSGGGTIEVRLDRPDGKLIGTLEVPAGSGEDQWIEVTTDIAGAEGVHDVYFVFRGKPDDRMLFKFDSWRFSP